MKQVGSAKVNAASKSFLYVAILFSHFLHTFTPPPPLKGQPPQPGPPHGATVGSHWADRLWKVLCQSTPGRVRWGSGHFVHFVHFITRASLWKNLDRVNSCQFSQFSLELIVFCWSYQAGQWWMRTKSHIRFWRIPQAWGCHCFDLTGLIPELFGGFRFLLFEYFT